MASFSGHIFSQIGMSEKELFGGRRAEVTFSRQYFRFDFTFLDVKESGFGPAPVPTNNGQGGREQIIKQFHRTLRPTLKPKTLKSSNFETAEEILHPDRRHSS